MKHHLLPFVVDMLLLLLLLLPREDIVSDTDEVAGVVTDSFQPITEEQMMKVVANLSSTSC